jgi:hypothetical protein
MNSLFVIQPYKNSGTWVFDDPERDLVKEPFVSGMPEIIDAMVKDIPLAHDGFRLLFSSEAFPGSTHQLHKERPECNGTWYSCPQTESEGWLCPALFQFYQDAPAVLHGRAESLAVLPAA